MSSKVEYLEKYSVAPPPSRDYYGIKVLQDEVILFLWKISHGPHKVPTIRVTKFSDFHEDKSLHDEIQHVFGDYMLKHVRNITLGQRNSILTFPRNVIAGISKYLKFKDLVNLTVLSRASNEVFDNDIIWETLYRRYKRGKICKEEKQYAMATSWKQLLKDKKLQESIKNHKPMEDKKVFKSQKINRTSNSNLTTSSINSNSFAFSKKAAEDSKKRLNQKPPLRLNTPSKITPDKKNINLKSTISMTKIPDQSTKNLFVTNKSKQDVKEKESVTNRSQLTINKSIPEKVNSLLKHKSSITLKSTEHVKNKKSSITNLLEPKLKSNEGLSLKNRKFIPDSKKRCKEINKAKKIGESKSTTLSTDTKTLFNDLHIDEINSLIEKSLTKLKTPRSMFDYDFSILGDKQSAGDSRILSPRLEIQNLKSESGHIEAILKTSARSDSHSEDDDSLDMSYFTQKYLDSRAEFMKKMSDASNLSFSKAQSSNTSSNGKFPKSLSTIPEKFKKTRASIFAAKEVENTNTVQDQFKIRSTKENNLLKK